MMASETHTYKVEEEESVRCPYCGAPLYKWAQESFDDFDWDEINTGHFDYKDKCEECGKEVEYSIGFILTDAHVEEEG